MSDKHPVRTALIFLAGVAVTASPVQAEIDLAEALTIEPYPLPADDVTTTLIRNATIWTMEGDGVMENADLLIDDGRIAAIGEGLDAPRDARVIDATGKHVTPGIIDAHSHSATEDLNINEGVYSISAEVRVRDILDPRSLDIYHQLAGGVTTIHVLHGSGNTIGGQNVIMKLRWGVSSPDELVFDGAPPTIKFALGENPIQAAFNTGPMSRGGREMRYPATRMGVAALLRASFERAAWYRDEWNRYESLPKRRQAREVPPRRDLQLEALVEVLDGERYVHTHAYRADEILMLMRLADEIGFKVDTFHHVLEGYKVADEMAAHGAAGSTFSDWWSFKMEAYDAIAYNAAIMERRGVLTSLNSDSANLARRMHIEAAKVLRYDGLDPVTALALVTINPARQLHIEDRVGSLAAGKDADVVIWNGDPLSVYSRVDTTFVDGRALFSRDADLAHRERVDAARRALAEEINGKPADAADDAAAREPATPNPPAPAADYAFSVFAPAEPVAIVGATVHTLEGAALEDGVVVFAGGRITAVGGPGTPIPEGARRVDASGRHLWPGIIHTNTVLGISEIDTVAGSVDVAETGEVNADADAAVAVNAASRHFPVARSAGITHAVVAPKGKLVAGTSVVVRTDGWTWEEMAGVQRHSLVVRWPAAIPARYARLLGPPKTMEERRKESDEIVDRLNEVFDAAAAYGKAVANDSGGLAPRYDPQLEALQPVLAGERPLWVSANAKHEIEAAVGWAASRELRVVITGAEEAHLVIDTLARHDVPVVLPDIAGDLPRADAPYDMMYSLPARLEAAGVTFAIASGTASGGSSNARHLTEFAGLAAAHGLDREAAYRSVTLYPARMLGLDDVLGSIATGKSASFVLTDGDLLEPGTTIEQVWIDGVESSMDDPHKAAYRKWSARPKAPNVR